MCYFEHVLRNGHSRCNVTKFTVSIKCLRGTLRRCKRPSANLSVHVHHVRTTLACAGPLSSTAPVADAHMPRTKKTEDVHKIDKFVGARVEAFRNQHEWTLADLAQRLDVSVSHLKALEAGRYSFSAAMLVQLGETFKRPVHAFLPETQRPESLAGEWEELRSALLPRDLRVLIEMGRKLVDWNPRREDAMKECTKVISLEGIDGTILKEVADKVVAKLGTAAEPVSCVWYDFDDPMTRYLVERILAMRNVINPDAEIRINHAFEKTLLFACERLQRQQTKIRPALQQGRSVITPFFTMAAGVYYEVDGSVDRRALESIETQLLKPDLVVVVDSDPNEAARRASLKLPLLKGTFYSPYERAEQFKEAMNVYEKLSREFTNRGYHVLRLDARKESSLEALAIKIIEAAHGRVETDVSVGKRR